MRTTAICLIAKLCVSMAFAQSVTVTGDVEGVTSGSPASASATIKVGIDGSQQPGTGSIVILSGGTLSATAGLEIGDATDSTGAVTVSGVGSSWVSGTTVGAVDIATRGGTGALTVDSGASFSSYKGSFSTGAGATVLFTGANTTVDIGSFTTEPDPLEYDDATGWLQIHEGQMTVSDGAHVQADGGYIGADGASLATVLVTGANTRWDNSIPLFVGGSGNGTVGYGLLTIADGAVVTAATSAAGADEDSEGEILIDGEGSKLEVKKRDRRAPNAERPGNMRVGYSGKGIVTVKNGGLLSADGVLDIATSDTSTGVLTIGGKLDDGPAGAGELSAGQGINFGLGNAKLVFNHTEDDYILSQTIKQTVDNGLTGMSEIIQAAGTTIYTGDGTEYNGQVSVRGGVLRVNDVLNGTFTVKTSGELGGKGSVGDVTVENGGTLRPGDTEGASTLSATSLQLNSGSKTVIDWSPTALNASLLVEDAATITGGAILDVTFAPGTLVKLTDKHHVMSLSNTAAGNVDGNFTLGTDSQNISRFLGLSLENDVASPDDVYLTVAQTANFDSVGGLNRRQTAVAKAAAGLADGSDLQTLLLNLQSDEDALDAFSALYGDVHEHQVASNLRGMSLAANSVMSRTGATSGSDVDTIDSNKAVWGTALYSRDTSSLNDVDATAGSVTTGLVAGADLFAFGDWTLGAYASFQNGETSGNEQSGSQDTKIVGVYSGMRGGAVNAALGLGVGLSSDKTTRRIALSDDVAEGAHQGTYVQAFGEVSKTFKIGKSGFLEPFVRMSMTQGQTEAFDETGSLAALSVGGGDFSERAGQIGVRSEVSVSGADSTARYFGSLALENVSRSGSFTKTFAEGGTMESVGLDGTSSQVAFQLGTTYDFNGAGNLSIAYEGKIGAETSDGALSLSIVKNF